MIFILRPSQLWNITQESRNHGHKGGSDPLPSSRGLDPAVIVIYLAIHDVDYLLKKF